MTRIASLVNAETIRLVGMALMHFLWQGVAIAAAGFVGMSLVRRASAKYVVGVAMLAVMVAAPAITYFVLAERHEPSRTVAVAVNAATAPRVEIAATNVPVAQIFSEEFADARNTPSIYLLWFVQAWFVGVVLLSLRPAAGFFLIERLRLKKGSPVSGELRVRCLELQRRLGLNRVVRYCESLQLEGPAVVGWFRPVILLPVSALTGLTALQLEAVIAHELAHVKRLDAFVNLFQMAAETLLFYHPAVWWLSKRIRAERENCCDDVAIAVCGNAVEYARALATMAEWQSAPALAMAANRSPLAERVARLLGIGKLSGGLRSAGMAGSVLCLCASVLAGNALLGVAQTNGGAVRDKEEQSAPEIAQGVAEGVAQGITQGVAQGVAQGVTQGVAREVTRPVLAGTARPRVNVRVEPEIAVGDSSVIEVRPDVRVAAPVIDPKRMFYPQQDAAGEKDERGAAAAREQEGRQEAREDADEQAHRGKSGSYIDGLKAEGLTDLSIDELISMKIQGVTAQYVREIHALDLKPDVNELVAMKIHGVTPEIIRQLRDAGLAREVNEIIAMQVQGVTPEYVKQLHEMGMATDGDSVLAMKVQGVSAEYVREMRGVTDPKLSGDELVAMKIQGVTPEYVKEMKAIGLQMNANDVIAMKVQGVTADYVKGLQAAGLKLDTNEVIGAKVQGITPEFIEKARSHGFQNLTINKLMALRNSGVLD
jgi:beta-lactamase regulating signal transducer with metallopeptidase domain